MLFIVATIAFLDDDDMKAKGERERRREKKERKKRKRKGGRYDKNMVLPFMFWKFFFPTTLRYLCLIWLQFPKEFLQQKSLQNHKMFKQEKVRPKMPLQTITSTNYNKTNKMQTLSKHNTYN